VIRLLALMFVSLLLTCSTGASADSRIVPAVRIGDVRLGDSQARVRAKLGKPERSYTTHGGRRMDRWEGRRFEVVYKARKVVQISTYIDRYKTASGLSTATTLATVKRLHPRLKRTTYFFDTKDPTDNETGEALEYYDDVRGGITFVVPRPWKQADIPEKPWIVIVHPSGRRAIPTEIPDPTH
jgi:hypothetical protein